MASLMLLTRNGDYDMITTVAVGKNNQNQLNHIYRKTYFFVHTNCFLYKYVYIYI